MEVVLSASGEQARPVHLKVLVPGERPTRHTWVRSMPGSTPYRMQDGVHPSSLPAQVCAITPIAEVSSSAERYTEQSTRHTEQSTRHTEQSTQPTEQSTRHTEHVQQEDMWESIGTTTHSASDRATACHNLQVQATPSRRSTTSVLLSEIVAAAPRGHPGPPGICISPSDSFEPPVRPPSGGSDAAVGAREHAHAAQVPSKTCQGGHAHPNFERGVRGYATEDALHVQVGAWGHGGEVGSRGLSSHDEHSCPRLDMHDAHTEPQMHGGNSWRAGSSPVTRVPEEGMRTALAEMEVEEAVLQLHEVVGRGAFGCVYRGTWRGLNVCTRCGSVLSQHALICLLAPRACVSVCASVWAKVLCAFQGADVRVMG